MNEKSPYKECGLLSQHAIFGKRKKITYAKKGFNITQHVNKSYKIMRKKWEKESLQDA